MNRGARTGLLWTPAEDSIIRDLGKKLEAKEIAARLTGRSEMAVFHRLRKLGLQKRRRWTARDDRRLCVLWGEPIRTVAKELGRSICTTYWRAQKLGLPLGVPEGGERLSRAADRSGYAVKTLRVILKWAGVPILRSLCRRALKTKRGTHWVDSDLVDAAVAKWVATDPQERGRRLVVLNADAAHWNRMHPDEEPLEGAGQQVEDLIDNIEAGLNNGRNPA